MDIKLTDAERIILANQYEILSILKKDDSYEVLANNLREGYEWLYSEVFNWVSPVMDSNDVNLVIDTLSLYELLRNSYRELSDQTGINPDELEFPGFDGNGEAKLRGFAMALLESERFAHVLGDDVKNSHMPSVDIYARMIDEWKSNGEPTYPLSKEQIQKILAARIHPENR